MLNKVLFSTPAVLPLRWAGVSPKAETTGELDGESGCEPKDSTQQGPEKAQRGVSDYPSLSDEIWRVLDEPGEGGYNYL